MTKNDINIKEILKETYKSKASEWNGKYNKTSRFCLPMIDLNISGKAISRFLKNAYLDDHTYEHNIERPLFLLMEVKNLHEKMWVELYKILTKNENYKKYYITDYYVGSRDEYNQIMFLMQIPKKWANDLEMFKNGSYSKFSNQYKSKFVQFNNDETECKEWAILNKTESYKDQLAKAFINLSTTTKEQAIKFRKEIDSWEEVYDKVWPAEEIYKYNATTSIISKEKCL